MLSIRVLLIDICPRKEYIRILMPVCKPEILLSATISA
jgi:hypothetical protein